MKFAIPEISWHNRDPVLSVDFQPKTDNIGPQRLATGGTDSHVLIWYISVTDTGSVNLEVAADLTRHQKAVNVVRWAPSGQLLASGDDESIIFIWKQKTEKEPVAVQNLEGEEPNKESWAIYKTLRGHLEDVLDLSWSPDSCHLASGSVDNKLILWDVAKGQYSCILSDHKGFVQGVAWDPKGQYIATASSDRTFRVFDVCSRKVVSRCSRAALPAACGPALAGVRRLFHDDTLQTFFRRASFSGDGRLLAAPAGLLEPDLGPPLHAVYIYSRYSLKVPLCVLPTGSAALATRWGPALAPRAGAGGGAPGAGGRAPGAGGGAGAIPGARRLLAVGTRRALLLYDTHQKTPVAVISNIHYTRLTDLSWSSDGLSLVASSTDGFCSVVTFERGELGEPVPETEQSPEPMEVQSDKTPETPKESEAPKEKEPKSTTPKIDSFIKFKAPTKSSKNTPQPKTPVKIDVLEEVAMPSWSDNSSNEIIRPKETEMEVDNVMIIEDSEDIKLVYEETEGPKSAEAIPSTKTSPETSVETEKNSKEIEKKESENTFFKQAKVTDVKTMPAQSVPSPKAPRRVNFVTLSSPKNKKKK